jgi:hypothetical protein
MSQLGIRNFFCPDPIFCQVAESDLKSLVNIPSSSILLTIVHVMDQSPAFQGVIMPANLISTRFCSVCDLMLMTTTSRGQRTVVQDELLASLSGGFSFQLCERPDEQSMENAWIC